MSDESQRAGDVDGARAQRESTGRDVPVRFVPTRESAAPIPGVPRAFPTPTRVPVVRSPLRADHCTIVLYRHGDAIVGVRGDQFVALGCPVPMAGADRPTGSWLEWSWDGTTFRLRTDYWGMYPCYWAEMDDRTVVSTSLAEVMREVDDQRWDDDAMAVFVRLGYLFATDTHFRAVRALPPNANVTTTTGRLGLQGQLSPPVRARSAMSREAALDHYIELFDQVVVSTLAVAQGRPIVPLSGGRDSRHILLAMHRAGADPLAVTACHFAPKPDEDQRIARLLCTATGSEHVVLEQPASRWRAEREKNRNVDCSTVEHSWYGVVRDHVRAQQSAVAVWDGIAGDVLSAGHFLTTERLRQFEAGKFEDFAVSLLSDGIALHSLLRPSDAREWSRDRAIARVAAEASRHAASANPVGQFFVWNRTRRGAAMACWGMTPHSAPVIAPFLDRRISAFLESLPASYFLDQTFHTESILKAYPSFASVPFEREDAPVRTDPARDRLLAREALRALVQTPVSPRRQMCARRFTVPRATLGAFSTTAALKHNWVYQAEALFLELQALRHQGG